MERCLSCSRAGPDIGTCGSFLTCPKQARPVDPKTEVTIRCDACDITRAVSVETLLRAKEPRVDHICPQGDCKAFIVRDTTAAAQHYGAADPIPVPAFLQTEEPVEFTPEEVAQISGDAPLPANPKAPRKKG